MIVKTLIALVLVGGLILVVSLLVKETRREHQTFTQEVRSHNPTATEYEIAVAKITKHLESLLGTPYQFGGVNPETGGVDCSGLLRVATVLAGYPCPRTNTKGIWATWAPVKGTPVGSVAVFFRNGRPVHVGYWVAPPVMIHASSSKGVERRDIHSQGGYWKKQYQDDRIIPSIEHLYRR